MDRKMLLGVLAAVCMVFGLFVLVAPASYARQADPPKIIRKSGGVLQGSALRRVEPSYPPLAKAARISGSVVVEVTVDEEGKVISARAISGHPLLKDSAVAAARGWAFQPTKLDGTPVKVIGTITFNYNLDKSEDIEHLKQRISESPSDANLYNELGELYASPGIGDSDKALDAFRQALSLKPDLAFAWMGIGQVYESMDHKDDAADAYRQAVKVDPANAHLGSAAFRLIGSIRLEQERYAEAAEAFKSAIAKEPDLDSTYVSLALVYIKMGDKESARDQYQALKKMRSGLAEGLLKQIEGQQ